MDDEIETYFKELPSMFKESKDKEVSIPDNITDLSSVENFEGIEPGCIYNIKNKLVRIQYPGIVENFDKALYTMGGISGIEKAVSQTPNKLWLNLHPRNKFNKGCVADCDSHSGLLLKIKVQKPRNEQPKYSYEIVGVTVRNFVFNKLIDYQYLPLIAEYPESTDSKVDFIYESILPKQLPTLESILKEDKVNMPLFLPPVGFSRSDTQRKLNPLEKRSNENTASTANTRKKNPKKHCAAFIKQEQASIFHKFTDPKVPQKPTEFISQFVKKRNYQDHLIKLQQFFEERPIWTKNGIKYNTNLSNDLLKILLPAVAYYQITGPWRCTWIRFGYDPREDPESRKYQNLDYRIPHPIRSNLKIGPKRNSSGKSAAPTSLKKLPSDDHRRSKYLYQESSYILRPNMLPPTQQMFYQYCDILLPELQTMLARLPPVPLNTVCDPKNGWFPSSFIEQCRETVSKYVDQYASNELLKRQQDPQYNASLPKISLPKSTDYCSLMIKNVKRGLLKETNPLLMDIEAGPSTSSQTVETSDVTDIVDIDSDESVYDENVYEYQDVDEIEKQWSTDGDLIVSEDQDMNIDMDALEEVKKIIADSNNK
ncbi:hypothetical protein WA026_016030 [Henosepilachna vigintioctopunctata]|uniref:General transcription factor 3C polypeptide 5 n=1 Tax=Henosepilachna vigintioctopunctata TaxID=420089 RepID=A0AAW1TZH5_9CUCU